MLETRAGQNARERFLIVRMSALGDIIHTLPSVAALRRSFPDVQFDWLVDRKWAPVLESNPAINHVIAFDRTSWRATLADIRDLRHAQYTTAIDFQSLYRSAILARFSGAGRRIGFDRRYAREPGAALFYTETVLPKRQHKVEHNLELAEAVGAKTDQIEFPLTIASDSEKEIARFAGALAGGDYFVLSPGGGWGSKCWPAERYGMLHREIAARYGLRGIVSFGPREEAIAEAVRKSAGSPEPIVKMFSIRQLMPLVRTAKFVVAGDTGPLHVAAALGTPVVGLYGPTDPARTGPFALPGGDARKNIVLRNASPEETTYRRDKKPARSMLSITVEQVLTAVEQILGKN